jgi:high-affinity Fe2+/Pb2+ permease
MSNLEQKPNESQRRDQIPLIVAAFGVVICAVGFYRGLEATGYNWTAAGFFTVTGVIIGFVFARRPRITL